MLAAAFIGLFAVPLLFLGCGLSGHDGAFLDAVTRWGTPVAYTLGALVCFAAVRGSRPDRKAWTWFALACSSWACANWYFALVVAPDPLPYPSPADVFYFSFPLLVCVGFVEVARARVKSLPRDVLLDSAMVSLCAGAVAAAVIFSEVAMHTASFGVVLNSIVYPVLDVTVIGVMVGVATLLRWRLDRSMWLLVAGITAITAGDLIVSTRLLKGDPVGGAWMNFAWTTGIALFSLAAWSAVGTRGVLPRRAVVRYHVGLPEAAMGVSLIVVALGALLGLSPVATVFAVLALGMGCIRMRMSFAEARDLADSRRLALADELTNLPNRRRLLHDLGNACEARTPSLLGLFDLDGFKHYNDTYGHPAGDALLIELSSRLAAAAAPVGMAYRLGGDEFCVLTPASAKGRAAMDEALAALAAEGDDWRVTATHGVVSIPDEADDTSEAMRIADGRMYAEKERRPVAARQQVRDVLLSAIGEQQPGLHAHTQDVTALAGAVAARLGMSRDEIDDVIRAAELHDVGKLAISPAILDKPGPLTDPEWQEMRRHTIIGERMLRAATALRPIALLVRSSHERWDGEGYPDRLRGEDIPLGARIVSVCDAYDAMVADRPYRQGMPPSAAVDELRRCAGTQFDPNVVEAFCSVLEASESALVSRR